MPTNLTSAGNARLIATLLPSRSNLTHYVARHTGIGIADSSYSPENLFEHKPEATVFAECGKDVTG
jgi:hypothetical protein